MHGGLLAEGAFRQFCQANKALKSIYVNPAQYDGSVVDVVISAIEDASQCLNLEEVVIACGELDTRLDRIAEASRELRKRGVDIMVRGFQYNYYL